MLDIAVRFDILSTTIVLNTTAYLGASSSNWSWVCLPAHAPRSSLKTVSAFTNVSRVAADPSPARSKWRVRARASDQGFLPIEITKYLTLLDWTGRQLREDKRGAIPDNLAPILDRLGLDRSNWVNTVRDFGRMFKQAAGRASSLARAAPHCSRRWFQGQAAARAAFV
jgi:hypothetical protein